MATTKLTCLSQHLSQSAPPLGSTFLSLEEKKKKSQKLPRTETLQPGLLAPESPSSKGMARVTMPSRDSLGSVDPDDVQVAEIDTLLVHQGRTGAALGPSGSPGCAGRGALHFVHSLSAEFCSQDSCEENRGSGWYESLFRCPE